MAKGSKYQDVKTAFQNAGFVNIKLHIEYDIITNTFKSFMNITHDFEIVMEFICDAVYF